MMIVSVMSPNIAVRPSAMCPGYTNDPSDHQILKFTPDGKFLQQIGEAGSTTARIPQHSWDAPPT
jgi:hypothetical protein